MGVNLAAIRVIVVEKLNFFVWHAVNPYAAGIDLKSNPSVLVVSGIMVWKGGRKRRKSEA
ncbi:MAG: hypothetical protein C4555_06685 [Dehalococcoidia bacterium]|nr:MAG: hypothetical protein C4555_06685 [Dehalococcoidia bacterium]